MGERKVIQRSSNREISRELGINCSEAVMIHKKKQSLRVALSPLANIAFTDITNSRAKPCFASSAARQFVSRQGGCPAKKLRVRGLVAAHLFTTKSALWCATSNAARDSESVNDSGTAQYPDRKTEDGHGDKGGKASIGDSSLNQRGSI